MAEIRRIRLGLEYLGTNYSGWQVQPDSVTVQQVVEEALEKITGVHSRVTASGRTDAGVHARHQPAHSDVATRISDGEIKHGMNALLPADVAVKSVTTVADDWHARFDALEKTYMYEAHIKGHLSPFDNGRVWHIPYELDVSAMHQCAKALMGEHDFTSFQSAGCSAKSPVREITRLEITRDGDRLRFEFTGTGFLKQMVRNIVGTLVDVGRGKGKSSHIKDAMDACDRKKAGPCAPSCGLYLVDVKYD